MMTLSKYSEIYRNGVINYLRDKNLLEKPSDIVCGNCNKNILHEEKRNTSIDGICFRCSTCGKRYSHRMNSPFFKSKISTDILIDIILFAFLMKISQKKVRFKHNLDKETVQSIYRFCRAVMKEEMDNLYKEIILGKINSIDLITDTDQYDINSNIIVDPNNRVYLDSPACEIDEVELGKHVVRNKSNYFDQKKQKLIKINAMGIYDRGTKFTKCFILLNKGVDVFRETILLNVETDENNKTRIYTDSFLSYNFLNEYGYEHYSINKQRLLQKGGKGAVTTNHIESYFGEIQATGVFKQAFQTNKEKQWELYLKEAEFRVHYKNTDLVDVFLRCLKNTKIEFPIFKKVNNNNNQI